MNLLERVNDAVKCGQNCINTVASNVSVVKTVQTIALCAFAYIAAKSDLAVVTALNGAFWGLVGASLISSYFKPSEALIIRNIKNIIIENFDRINVEPFHGIIALNNGVINFELVDGGRLC